MAFLYNGSTPLITSDDIIVTKGNENAGENLSTILDQQSKDIAQLKGNVKWIAKYGGVGGNGGSGGGGESATSTKFNLRISYTDNNDLPATINASSKQSSLAPILVKAEKPVNVTVSLTSKMSADTVYRAVLYIDETQKSAVITQALGNAVFSFPAKAVRHNCRIEVTGETTSFVDFTVFTRIVNNNIHLQQGVKMFGNNSSLDPADIPGLKLYTTVENLLSDLFQLYIENASINGNVLDVPLNSSIDIELYFYNLHGENAYGLYNVIVNFKAVNTLTGDLYQYNVNYVFIYKKSTEVFVYCYTTANSFIVYNDELDSGEIPLGTDLRSIPLVFRVYGTNLDTSSTSYAVTINGEEYKRTCKVEVDYQYALKNTTLSSEYQVVPITFTAGNFTTTYYVYLKSPGQLSYMFLKPGSDEKCFGSVGDNTDTLPANRNGSVLFPPEIPGDPYWTFSTENNNVLTVIDGPQGYLTNESEIVDIYNFIAESTLQLSNSRMYDGIINIGINYQDSSYDNPIFTIEGPGNRPIIFYRNKIVNGDLGSTDRFGIPEDGKFHLITIYFKVNYRITNTSTLWGTHKSFAVYIDGVLDVKPTDTNFAFGPNCTCTFHSGKTQYNFFGVESFNPVPFSVVDSFGNPIRGYNNAVRKYVLDYDPFIVSNYYMCYASIHYADLGYNMSPYTDEQLNTMGASIYYTLITGNGNYVNYYNTDDNTYNKFIPVDVLQFSTLLGRDSNIPIYRIVPLFNSKDESVQDGLHKFIRETLISMGEDEKSYQSVREGYQCKIQRYDSGTNEWVDLLDRMTIDGVSHIINFRVKFQGSSTLLYSVKNFYIETIPNYDLDHDITYTYYFNPDSEKFNYPETNFNLKADLVDSSSCTNNVMGNFINNYIPSPFNRDNREYKSCLSGRPILLFVNNNISNEASATNEDLFLGIYNLNLNRSSVNNLGYLRIPDSVPIIDKNTQGSNIKFDNVYCQIVTNNTAPIIPEGLAVAEVQGNGNVYDFTLYDYGLLHQIFGDFYTISGGKVTEEYSSALQLISRDFAFYVRDRIVRNNNTDVFPTIDYGLSVAHNYLDYLLQLYGLDKVGYYEMTSSGIRFKTLSEISNPKVIDYDSLNGGEGVIAYKSKDSSNCSKVGNSQYQFHLVYHNDGNNITPIASPNYFYYVEENVNTTYSPLDYPLHFDLVTSIKYYMTCMAFAMVDSVLKNMNIKRPDNGTVWYPLFYDMDTALGLDNAGNNSNYKAFSDYVDDKGNIISDYAGEDATQWFDTPSSYLFLYAKYDAILNHQLEEDLKFQTPLEHWLSLRDVPVNLSNVECKGVLKDAATFCDTYLDTYIDKNIPPIIWNLNYMYKYFSESSNMGNIGDTEEQRFNGRMIYRRRTWLAQRLHYLDALFGIANTRPIGHSASYITGGMEVPPKPLTNKDVEVCRTMFPQFKKGLSSANIDMVVRDQPRTPIIFQSSTRTFTLYITKDNGEARIINQVNGNVDIALNGTMHLTYVDDCGDVLLNPSELNTIVGDLITMIVINTDCMSFKLDLKDLPSVKEIVIGNSSSNRKLKVLGNDGITIIGNDETEIDLYVYNVMCQALTVQNCILSALSLIRDISPISTGCALNISDCSFKGSMNISSSDFTDISMTSNNHYGDFTINSGLSCILSITSMLFRGDYTFNIDIQRLTLLTISSSTIYHLNHLSSLLLLTCSIGLTNSAEGIQAEINLNSNSANVGNTSLVPYSITTSNSNSALTSLSISLNGSYLPIILRIPLFKNLLQLNLTGRFILGKMGLAGDGLLSIVLNPTATDGIIGLYSNADSVFAHYEGSLLNASNQELTESDWEILLSNVTSIILGFGNRNKGLNINTICNILNGIKQGNKQCNIKGLFAATKITLKDSQLVESAAEWNNLSFSNRLTYLNRIAEAYPLNAVNRGAYIFYRTNMNYLTAAIAAKIGTTYESFMGTSGSYIYILSKALSSVLYITNSNSQPGWVSGGADLTSFFPYIRFFNIVNNSYAEHTTVKYSEEFTAAKELFLDVYTSDTVSFDYGTGMGSNITKYRGLFRHIGSGANKGNIYNIKNMFNGTTKLSASNVGYDFYNLGLHTSELPTRTSDERVVDLYLFLVTNESLNEKAYRVLASRGSDTENYCLQGSFCKKITAANFKKLLGLLASKGKTDISCIFHNCSVTGVEDISTFFPECFYSVLHKFTRMYATFRRCKFYSASNINSELPMVLDNAFAYKALEGGTTQYGKSVIHNIPRTFEYCYIKAFSDDGLGITDGSVRNGYRTFAECKFKYDNNTEGYMPRYNGERIKIFNIPSGSDAKPLLPENFLSFCAPISEATNSMFSCSSYDSEHLTGYLPETEGYAANWLGYGVVLYNTFKGCNIYYHKYDESNNYKWIIFPNWYCYASLLDNTASPFNVYIPYPLRMRDLNTDMELCVCSIFGNAEDVKILGDYGTLPRLPEPISTYQGYNTDAAVYNVDDKCNIYLVQDNSHELPLKGSYFKYIIPGMLAPLIALDSTDSTIVRDVMTFSSNSYNPIVDKRNNAYLPDSIIFRGILVGVEEGTPLSQVISGT